MFIKGAPNQGILIPNNSQLSFMHMHLSTHASFSIYLFLSLSVSLCLTLFFFLFLFLSLSLFTFVFLFLSFLSTFDDFPFRCLSLSLSTYNVFLFLSLSLFLYLFLILSEHEAAPMELGALLSDHHRCCMLSPQAPEDDQEPSYAGRPSSTHAGLGLDEDRPVPAFSWGSCKRRK